MQCSVYNHFAPLDVGIKIGEQKSTTALHFLTVRRIPVLAVILCLIGIPTLSRGSGLPEASYRYRSMLVRESHAVWGLDAPVADFAAQLHQESRWRVQALSPVGAKGLGQAMPATARWLATIDPQLAPVRITSPGWDIRALVVYDHWLWARTNAANDCEHMAKVMRAYNGGLGWLYKDERKARAQGINVAYNFGQLDQVNAGRNQSAFTQNTEYPRLILRKFEPQYIAAGFGRGVCA
ncbi:transglycosylase SLT domain-containing protein [Chitinimonas sp.]|uniref:transglycosylase SLT domain-containing protein n=1 Tax=Chitinimonas sp. TaxID=1934313 RepID=UPI0035B27AC2